MQVRRVDAAFIIIFLTVYLSVIFNCVFSTLLKNRWCGAARVAQQFSAAFSPGHDPEDPGWSPTPDPGRGFSLCFSLSVFLMNK